MKRVKKPSDPRVCGDCIHLNGEACMKHGVPFTLGCDDFWPEEPACKSCRLGYAQGEAVACRHSSARIATAEKVTISMFKPEHHCEHWRAKVSRG